MIWTNAIITEQSKSGSYTFRVNSGATLHARYALFEYMDASGIQLLSGAVLDALNNFSNVTFDNGTSGGTMLYVENLFGLNQVFTIVSASFPSNPGGGASNVTKSVSSDTLDFQSSTGSFAGEDFDNDPGNLVQWGSVSDLLTWTGSASTNWHTASNWSPVGVPDGTKAVVINDQSNDPVIGNDNAAALEVTIGSGATLTIQDGFDFDIDGDLTNSSGTLVIGNTTSTMNIAGGWANSGTFTNGNSTITFDGTENQTIDAGGIGTGKAFYNINCTNPDTIELQGTLDVDGDLVISDGYFYLNGNQLIFGDTSADSLLISGEVIINDDAILQMASGTRIVVESGGNLKIQGTSDATVRLYYGRDELGGEVEADLQMWRRRNDLWEQLGGTVNSSQNYVEVSSSVYTFSAGIVDTLILSDAQNEESLPVELLSFNAIVMRDSVILNWITATELENAFWIIDKKNISYSEYEKIQRGDLSIEKTTANYSQLSQIEGMGSKPTVTRYKFVDHGVKFGKIYAYRLSSVSLNGEIETFTPIIASYSDWKMPETYVLEQNYPNPFNPVTTINYRVPFESKVKIEVYNILGQTVTKLVDDKKEAGFYDVQWNGYAQNGTQVASGVYIYRMTAEAIDSREKFAMNKRMILVK